MNSPFRTAAAATFALVLSPLSPAHAATVEKVTLTDADGAMKVMASKKTLKAGKVTFDVTNPKTSGSEHEMIVVRLTPEQVANPMSLPYVDAENKVDEERIKDLGEVSELQPGQSGSLTLTLPPATYMLLCNVAGHYKAGMFTLVTVK